MKIKLLAVIFLATSLPAAAHRLDEYLQAALISIEIDRVQVQLRLTPGVAVLPLVLGQIDRDRDGAISQVEQQTYVSNVIAGLSLSVDGNRQPLHLVSNTFPTLLEFNAGQGEIRLELRADIPTRSAQRRLIFENHHQAAIAAYLVNCLVPSNPEIRITSQNRNYQQSFYEVDYTQTGAHPLPSFQSLSGSDRWIAAVALLLTARLVWLWWRRRSQPSC